MKEYLPLNQNDLVITNNQNYIINEGTNNILVKSGVVTNLLTYNNLDDVILNLEVEKDAVVNIYQIVNTTKQMKLIEKVDLKEQGATVNSIVVLLGTADSKIDSDIKIYHNTNHTYSDLKVYVVVKDNANVNLDNNAYIKKNSYQSVAHQNAKGLNLSKTANILVNPNLYIDEYDVMASHGVAMGSLNKDDLFYLMSRGLTVEEASHIVIMGFIEPILLAIDNEQLTKTIREQFKQNLE